MGVDCRSIADYLRGLKEEKGWTAQAWAEASGVPTQTISRLLNAQTDAPNFDSVALLVKAAGGSLDELVGIVRPPVVEEKIVRAPSDTEFIAVQRAALEELHGTIRHFRISCYVAWGVTAFVLFTIIGILIYDILNLNVGWIRQQISHFSGDLLRIFRG